MSKPFYEDLFAFHGRRNRKSFLMYNTVWLVAFLALLWNIEYQGIVWGWLLFIMVVSGSLVSAQRCRDFGWTGWAFLLMAFPYLGLIFGLAICLLPGNVGENRYGPDPLK